jgi:hypothetical protein
VDVILLLHVFIVSFSLSLIKWTSPVDVGNLSNHVKYCVSVLTLRRATISTPPVRAWGSRDSPTIGIRAHGLKGCLILLKNKSCQNCVLTIPLYRGGRDEATVENRVEIGRQKRPHAPSRSGRVAGHTHRRAPRVTRVFFARMG